VTLYRKNDLEKTKEILEAIPRRAERTGELAVVPYLLADCLLRMAPVKVDDALAAGKKPQEELQGAVELLESFCCRSNPPSPAGFLTRLLKNWAWCYQRLAGLLADPQERVKMYTSARTAYEKAHEINSRKTPTSPQAVFERAKVLAQAGRRPAAPSKSCSAFSHDPPQEQHHPRRWR